MIGYRDGLIVILRAVLSAALESTSKAEALVGQCYHSPSKVALFQRPSLHYNRARHLFQCTSLLANTLLSLSDAFASHLDGERAFFQKQYSTAEKRYRRAIRHCKDAYSSATHAQRNLARHPVKLGSDSSHRYHAKLASAVRIIESYRSFFEIEGLEAMAFKIREAGGIKNLAEAKRLHAIEIQATKKALRKMGRVRHPLRVKLEGHVWYARSNCFQCSSQIAFVTGQKKEAVRLERLAIDAETRSVKCNPQWKGWLNNLRA